MCVGVFTCVKVCAPHACIQCPQEPEDDDRSPGSGTTDGCELLRRHWDLNPSHQEKQPVLSNTEPTLQASFGGTEASFVLLTLQLRSSTDEAICKSWSQAGCAGTYASMFAHLIMMEGN